MVQQESKDWNRYPHDQMIENFQQQAQAQAHAQAQAQAQNQQPPEEKEKIMPPASLNNNDNNNITLKQSISQKAYSALSYAIISWICLAVFLIYLYYVGRDKITYKFSSETMNLMKGSFLMNGILLIVFHLAVQLYKPLDATPASCEDGQGPSSFVKFVDLLREVAINVLPLVLTLFLGYQCTLNMDTVAWASLIPAALFLLYLSIFPVDKIYQKNRKIKINRSGNNPQKPMHQAGSVMSIVPPTLAVYAMMVGLYYYMNRNK